MTRKTWGHGSTRRRSVPPTQRQPAAPDPSSASSTRRYEAGAPTSGPACPPPPSQTWPATPGTGSYGGRGANTAGSQNLADQPRLWPESRVGHAFGMTAQDVPGG